MSGRKREVRAGPTEGPKPKLTARAAFLIVAVVLLALLAVSPVRAYLDQGTQIAELERQARVLEGANARLRANIAELRDPAELERLARECLGLVGRGEVAPGPHKARPAAVPGC